MKVEVERVALVLSFNDEGRSPGIHVSNIIRLIATETGILKTEVLEELSLIEVASSMRFLDPVVALRVSFGLAWEDYYIREHLAPQGVVKHPGEYCVDGIYMSPDGEELVSVVIDRRPLHRMKIHEVKFTYKSTKTVGEHEGELVSQFLWMAQIKAYCKGAGTTLADLHVVFVCGDYHYPIQPMMKIFHLEFDQEEIDDNWNMLTAYKEHRMQVEGLNGNTPVLE